MDINNSKKQTLDRLSYRRLCLYPDYRFVNSNYTFGQGSLPYIKHGPYRRQLEAVLLNSDGGAILVTGFRGVGKSTLAHNAISALNQSGQYRMIPISVVLPAEKTYGQVLVEIIRRLYETLKSEVFWDKLKTETQERIRLAYSRTLLNIKRSNNLAVEGELSMQPPLEWLPGAKAKKSRQRAEEKSYLLFSEQDIEYKLTQCIEALHKANHRNRVIIIIDEIDKLTATKDGVVCFDNLLERMKNLISSTNALFVFIAGIEVYKRWENDRQKINSLYDSLFSPGCVSRTTRIYSAPEVYLSECTAASDYYSACILLVEMIAGKSLCKHYVERHINVKCVLEEVPCSQKLKDTLVKATAFDPANRYANSADLIKALNRCPEFRKVKEIPIPKSMDGTVCGHDIRIAVPVVPEGIEHMLSDSTIFLGDAYFDNNNETIFLKESQNKAAYLVRQSNNERIVLDKSVFRIGRPQTSADYCLASNLISRLHAEFNKDKDKFYLKDLNSVNGTYVNSQKLEPAKAYRINHGDRIRLANEEFVFYER